MIHKSFIGFKALIPVLKSIELGIAVIRAIPAPSINFPASIGQTNNIQSRRMIKRTKM